MTDQISRLPQTGVVLDLDLEEREPSEADRPPFVVNISGKAVTLIDPDLIDWIELAEVRLPSDLLRLAASREDFLHVTGSNLPQWKFKRLMDRYAEHYDLEEKIHAARRQAQLRGL